MESNVSLQYPHCGGRLQVGSKKMEKKGLAAVVTAERPSGSHRPMYDLILQILIIMILEAKKRWTWLDGCWAFFQTET